MCGVSAKIPELGGASHHPVFMGKWPIIGHTFGFVNLVDECPCKEMKMCCQFEISFYCLVFGVN